MGILLLVPSAGAAVAPMVTVAALVWWLDRYEREPVWLLGLTFSWGAFGGVFCGIAASLTLMAPLRWLGLPSDLRDALGTVVVAPMAEEPAKAVFLLFVLWSRNLFRATDGFVYGATAGLGFGMTENFMYFSTVAMQGEFPEWFNTVLVRTAYSAVMHGCATSLVGASVGLARHRSKCAGVAWVCAGLLSAMLVHALWNGLITLDVRSPDQGRYQHINLVLLPLEALTLIALFHLGLRRESSTIRRELNVDAAAGLIPGDHPEILADSRRRRARGWLPPHVDHARYVRTCTRLAFRRAAVRAGGGESYRADVFRLRREVALLLGRAPPKG